MGCFVAGWIIAILASAFLLLAPGVGLFGLLPVTLAVIATYIILRSGGGEPEGETAPSGPATADVPPRIVDLTRLESTRTRIKGSSHVISDSGRARSGGSEYLLMREPGNPHDANAVAVYGGGRKVGYLSAARAASTAPLLDQIGADAFRVTGTGVSRNSVMLWVDAPKIAELRKMAQEIQPRGQP